MTTEYAIKLAADAVAEAGALMINAGAGMGVDSGLPDFRGNEGFWKAYPPMKKLGVSFAEMANPYWFARDPALAWGFYGHRLNLYRATTPHEGFDTLLQLGKSKPNGYFVFTSNVDGQFQKAGFSPNRIAECHGSISHYQCADSCSGDIWRAPPEDVPIDERSFRAKQPYPTCPNCGGLARPNVLMFGDWSWIGSRTYDQEGRLGRWLDDLRDKKLTIVECGAGTSVPTVRHKSESVVRTFGAKLVRINPRDSRGPDGTVSVPLGAKEGVERIVEKLQQSV